MIWRPTYHSTIAKLVDFFTVIIGLIIAYIVWHILYSLDYYFIPKPFKLHDIHYLQGIILAFLYVFIINYYKAYSYQRFTSIFREYVIVLKASTISLLIMVFFSYMIGEKELPRTIVLLSFSSVLLLLIVQKSLLFYVAQILRLKGKNRKRILVIGTGERAIAFIKIAKKNKSWGLDIVGLLTGDTNKIGQIVEKVKIIGHYDDIEEHFRSINPEEIMITISTKRFDKLRKILDVCELIGAQVRLNSDFFGRISKHVKIDNVYKLNIISFNYTKQSDFSLLLKRIFDFLCSFFLLFLLSPLLIIIAVIILIQDGSPIFYEWDVVGLNRKPIKSWKFRTMVRNADEIKKELMKDNEMSGPVFKITNDPRILPIGHFLRKYSLDELPQLFSVLKGDLSLVGPRPPLQYEFKEFDIWHRRKLSVKPGLTCLWQVSGRSAITDFNDWAKLDLEYIDNWSLALDFKILLKTIPVVLFGRGAK